MNIYSKPFVSYGQFGDLLKKCRFSAPAVTCNEESAMGAKAVIQSVSYQRKLRSATKKVLRLTTKGWSKGVLAHDFTSLVHSLRVLI